jgi:hypothetical protein
VASVAPVTKASAPKKPAAARKARSEAKPSPAPQPIKLKAVPNSPTK